MPHETSSPRADGAPPPRRRRKGALEDLLGWLPCVSDPSEGYPYYRQAWSVASEEGIQLNEAQLFPDNEIRTSVYTIYDFLPRFLFYQFQRLANGECRPNRLAWPGGRRRQTLNKAGFALPHAPAAHPPRPRHLSKPQMLQVDGFEGRKMGSRGARPYGSRFRSGCSDSKRVRVSWAWLGGPWQQQQPRRPAPPRRSRMRLF